MWLEGAEVGKLQEPDGRAGLRAWKKRSNLHMNVSAVHREVRSWPILSVHTATRPQAHMQKEGKTEE